MVNWITNHWEFLIGEIIVPIVLFIVGFFSGKVYEKKKPQKQMPLLKAITI